ncbi:hypothetical protein CHS0354_015998 [Potamilus streckersoni]|uniref:Uncharacterized protein n=1 Tax=Potamilus streckersoni TaxID=2493646 RepID=A0AAE0SY92_9BIVA|nr:hypothetical protein CHS0354_015998 [Potamilus streckersoni]
MEFRLKTGGDPINRLVAMVNSTFATSRDEVNQTVCPTMAGDSGANWTLYDSIPFTANAGPTACGGKYDSVSGVKLQKSSQLELVKLGPIEMKIEVEAMKTPNCAYWVIKAERYTDFNSYYDCYYAIKCCQTDAVNLYQEVNATIGDIHIVNKSSDADLALTVRRATDNTTVGSSTPLELGDSYYLQLEFSCQPKTGNYVEGISTFGVKAKWCMVKQQVNATPGFQN